MNKSLIHRITADAMRADHLDNDAFASLLDDIMALAEDDLSDLLRTDRSTLSHALLSLSICPIHFCDYAICFDDMNDCTSIRTAFPAHNS